MSLRPLSYPSGFVITQCGDAQVLYDAERFSSPSQRWFNPGATDSQSEPVQSAGGRNAAWFIELCGQGAVLRHYRRGGLAAKFLKESYLWTGLSSTRAFIELCLLQSLVRQGLAVAQPLAAAVWRHGLVYRAALITQRISGAEPLSRSRDLVTWQRAGELIAQMHRLGVYHADLNVFNLLLDGQGRLWLIDFDRSWQGVLTHTQRKNNLSRLLRSVHKVLPELGHAYFDALLYGYDTAYAGKAIGAV